MPVHQKKQKKCQELQCHESDTGCSEDVPAVPNENKWAWLAGSVMSHCLLIGSPDSTVSRKHLREPELHVYLCTHIRK